MKIKRLVLIPALFPFLTGSTYASDKSAELWKVVGVLTGGACIVGFFKYARDAITHWSDRRLIGAARSEAFLLQEKYREVLHLYHEAGIDGVRDYIIAQGKDPLVQISLFTRTLRARIASVNSHISQLAYLAKKNESRDELLAIQDEISRESMLVNDLISLYNSLDSRRALFELEVVLGSSLPGKNVQSPFQTIEQVSLLTQRMEFLQGRYQKLSLRKQQDQKSYILLQKTRSLVKELNSRIQKIMQTDDYKHELRLKKDAEIAQERIDLERKRFAVEKRRLEVEEEKARELRRKNRLEEARLNQDNQEKIILASKNKQADEQKILLQKQLSTRMEQARLLQEKVLLLEEQKQQLQAEISRIQGGSNEYRQIVVRLEKRILELQQKIDRLKKLIDNPPMNPNHQDYGAFLAQQIKAL